MQGEIQISMLPVLAAITQVKAGRLKAIAVTGAQRSQAVPEIPTIGETIPGYEVMSFNGIGAPRGTPRSIVVRLNREIHAVLEQPDIRRRLVEQGNEVRPGTPEEMTRKVGSEIAKWRRIVESRQIQVQ